MKKLAGVVVLVGTSFSGSWAAAAEDCAPSGDLKMICGPEAVEDLVRVGRT